MTRAVARRIVHGFAADLARERRGFAESALLALGAVLAGVAAPWPLQWLIDGLLGGDGLPAPLARVQQRGSPALAALAIAAASLAIGLTRVGASTRQRALEVKIRERLGLSVRERVLRQLLTLPPTFSSTHRSGDLVDRLVTDSNLLVRLATKTLPETLQHLATTLATLVAMFAIEPRLGLLGAVALPPLAGLARRHARALQDASRTKRGSEGMLAGVAQEIVRGLPTLQASGEEAIAIARFREIASRSLAAGASEAAAGLAMERMLQVGQALALAALLGLGGVLVLRAQLSVGELAVFVSYLTQVLKPVEKINELAAALAKGVAGAERLLDILAFAPAVQDLPHARDAEAPHGVVALHDVHFAYRDGAAILRGVDLTLTPGRLYVLTGASGAGKSTLVQLLARAFDPDAGVITLDGAPLRELTLRSLRRQIAVMSQRGHLFAGTLRSVLGELAPEASDERLMHALASVALDDFVAGLPRGLDTPLGEDGVNLSGGQRQRLALARVTLSPRRIVLLDEPTAAVDAASQRVLLSAITALARERTLLVVTHRAALLEAADVVLTLEAGRIRRAEKREDAA